jgi:hypothetical protein
MANPVLAQHFRCGAEGPEALHRGADPQAGDDVRQTQRTAAWLVARMGPAGPARPAPGTDSGGEPELFAWWVACLLAAGERRAARVESALAALRTRGWLAAPKLAQAGTALAQVLSEAGLRTPEIVAARLARASAALVERYEGSLERLAAGGPDLEELGGRLVALGPGLGPGTALRFLRPLRDRWSAAADAPLDPAAHAAAVHLGWLDEHDDLEMAPALLRRRLDDEPSAPPLSAVEDALERLGRVACRRRNTSRCPLGDDCPGRGDGFAARAGDCSARD